MDGKLAVAGLMFQRELSTTQVPISTGASGAFAASNNIATLTFTSAHGLTLNPTAGTLPNYFFQIPSGVTAQSGIGTLNGPIFRILSIPSTTTITFYTTVTAATLASVNVIPVFVMPFIGQNVSGFANGPTQTVTGVTTTYPPAWVGSGVANVVTGANCTVQYNPDNTSVIQDPSAGNTLSTGPTYRNLQAASTQGQIWMSDVSCAIFASGSAGTTRVSVIE